MSVVLSRRALALAATCALAGCGGGVASSVSPTQQTLASTRSAHAATARFVHAGVPFMPRSNSDSHARGAATYPTKRPLLLVSNQDTASVGIYQIMRVKKNPKAIASIASTSGCPYGLAFDHQGTLYVASNCEGNTVTEYAKGSTSPGTVITTGISNPLGLATDASGDLYVSNYPAAITVYPPGATSPSETITGGGLIDPFGVALDKNQNLFIADFGAHQVFEVLKGSTTPTALNLQDATEPIGVAFDKQGNLWVTDGAGDQVQIYAPGSTVPSRTISGMFSFPYAIAFDAAGTAFISDVDQNTVYGFKPGASTPYAKLTNGLSAPTGVLAGKP